MVNGTILSFQKMHHIVPVIFLQPFSKGFCKAKKFIYKFGVIIIGDRNE